MSDAIEPRPSTPFPAEGSAPAPALIDPLAGDWSEGLHGPVRALGIPAPQLLSLEGIPLSVPALTTVAEPPAAAPVAEVVEAPDAWASTEDPLESTPPPVAP